MKRIHIIFKTHLDLGFTDLASNVLHEYLYNYIPKAIELANDPELKGKFVWTVGSYIIKKALEIENEEYTENLINAIRRGQITYHAMPFTTITELMDTKLLAYGLNIKNRLDMQFFKKTISAKLTDVPGHTRGLVTALVQNGVKMLHIGVNQASAMPHVPDCFRYMDDRGDSVIVVYSKNYGEMFSPTFTDEKLYFVHTGDNVGVPTKERILEVYKELEAKYPGYELLASTLDFFAQILQDHKQVIPFLQGEIGDTWVHGVQSDPYKTAALKSLLRYKDQLLSKKLITSDSLEYDGFMENLLCVTEHTWGVDSKRYLHDYYHYKKDDFKTARAKDIVTTRHGIKYLMDNIIYSIQRKTQKLPQRSYSFVEKATEEQRDYLTKAIACLPEPLQNNANTLLLALRPTDSLDVSRHKSCNFSKEREYHFGNKTIVLDKFGGIKKYAIDNVVIIDNHNSYGAVSYNAYKSKDFKMFFDSYIRNRRSTWVWARADFGKPLLSLQDNGYDGGRYFYTMTELHLLAEENYLDFICTLSTLRELSDNLGAPREVQIEYRFYKDKNKVDINVIWLDKDANRLPEAIYYHIFPKVRTNHLTVTKLGIPIKPIDIVSKGGKKNMATTAVSFLTGDYKVEITNLDQALVSTGLGNTLLFDDKLSSVYEEGLSYNLYNNIWGTNFPLYYEDNARFRFGINITKSK